VTRAARPCSLVRDGGPPGSQCSAFIAGLRQEPGKARSVASRLLAGAPLEALPAGVFPDAVAAARAVGVGLAFVVRAVVPQALGVLAAVGVDGAGVAAAVGVRTARRGHTLTEEADGLPLGRGAVAQAGPAGATVVVGRAGVHAGATVPAVRAVTTGQLGAFVVGVAAPPIFPCRRGSPRRVRR
jgi:hypothetical protein